MSPVEKMSFFENGCSSQECIVGSQKKCYNSPEQKTEKEG